MDIETVRLTNGEELFGIVRNKKDIIVVVYQYRWSEYYRRFDFLCQRKIPKQNISSIGM